MYKQTFLDRHGPDGVRHLRGLGYGLTVFGSVTGTLLSHVGFRWWVLPAGLASGAFVGSSGWWIGELVGAAWKRFMVDGTSTPYVDQYSYQQALVMRGETDEALASFEAVIAERPHEASPRLKAAELYVREKRDYERAAALFRQVQRIEKVSRGDDILATNRLADLLTGPLNNPARALIEMRRLVDRHPDSAAAEHARGVIITLKERVRAIAPD